MDTDDDRDGHDEEPSVAARLARIEERLEHTDRLITTSHADQAGRLQFLRNRAGWILVWTVIGLLGSCSHMGSDDDASDISQINSTLNQLTQNRPVASNDDLKAACRLLGEVSARQGVTPAGDPDLTSTDCLDEAKAGYDAAVKAAKAATKSTAPQPSPTKR